MRDDLIFRALQPFEDKYVTCETHGDTEKCRVLFQSLVPSGIERSCNGEDQKNPWMNQATRNSSELVPSISVNSSYIVRRKDGKTCVQRLCSICDSDEHETSKCTETAASVVRMKNPTWISMIEAESDEMVSEYKEKLFQDKSNQAIVQFTEKGYPGLGVDVLVRSLDFTRIVILLQNKGTVNGFPNTFDYLPLEHLRSWDGNSLNYYDVSANLVVTTTSPFVAFKNDLIIPNTPKKTIINNVGEYTLCAIMLGIGGHFQTHVLTREGWYNLIDNKHEERETPKDGGDVDASFFLYTKLRQNDLPSHKKYITLTLKIQNTCFINASIHMFKLIWTCVTEGLVKLHF